MMRRVAAILLVLGALVLNVFTLAPFASGGRVDGVARLYLTYIDILLLLGAATLLVRAPRVRRVLGRILYVLVMLFWIEVFAVFAFRILSGGWHFERSDTATVFEPHPYLVGAPEPGASATKRGKTISHNRLGFRGPDVPVQPPEGVTRIAAVGGSSTYGAGVTDGETWPEYLEQELGPGWQVLNLGVPGYGTAEHVIQTALRLSDLRPAIVLYYVGWNDIRNAHLADLQPDYSDFHGKSQHRNLNLGRIWRGPNLAAVRLPVFLFQGVGWMDRTPEQTISIREDASAEAEQRALDLYERNLRSLITLCRAQGIQPVVVPQVLNYALLAGDGPNDWIPFIPAKDLRRVMAAYNERLRDVAAREKVPCVNEVLEVEWPQSDFIDEGHFTPEGNREFARLLAKFLVERKLLKRARAASR